MSDPWMAPSGEQSFEQNLSPHERRMWDAYVRYDATCAGLVAQENSQYNEAVQMGRRANVFQISADGILENYVMLRTQVAYIASQQVEAVFNETNLLLAQHGPDLALWAQISRVANVAPKLPYDLLGRASSYASEWAMRAALDATVWNRVRAAAGSPELVEKAISEASSPNSARMMRLVFDGRSIERLKNDIAQPTLGSYLGTVALQFLSPRSRLLVNTAGVHAVKRATGRMGSCNVSTVPHESPGSHRSDAAGVIGDAEWIVGQLPPLVADRLRPNMARVQGVVNSVRRARATYFLKGRIISDVALLNLLGKASEAMGNSGEAMYTYNVMYDLMANDPNGKLPF